MAIVNAAIWRNVKKPFLKQMCPLYRVFHLQNFNFFQCQSRFNSITTFNCHFSLFKDASTKQPYFPQLALLCFFLWLILRMLTIYGLIQAIVNWIFGLVVAKRSRLKKSCPLPPNVEDKQNVKLKGEIRDVRNIFSCMRGSVSTTLSVYPLACGSIVTETVATS